MAGQIFTNVPKSLKPTKSPRFHAGDKNDAGTAAIRTSAYYNCTAYIYATCFGYKVSLEIPSLPRGNCYESIIAVYDAGQLTYTVTYETHHT